MNFLDVFKEKINYLWGAAAAVLLTVFGEFWWLFGAFFLLEVADYMTGWWKARQTQTENSLKGAIGIAKKVGYWVVIAIAFFFSVACEQMGRMAGINLAFMNLVGYFVLVTYIVNEIRSVLENLIVIGVTVPEFLVKGLAVAEKLIADKSKGILPQEENKGYHKMDAK